VTIINFILNYVEPVTCTFGATNAAPSGSTSRPLQPLNGRTITHKCPTGTGLTCAVDPNATKKCPGENLIKKKDFISCRDQCVSESRVALKLKLGWSCGHC
jgi:hypothetical protein